MNDTINFTIISNQDKIKELMKESDLRVNFHDVGGGFWASLEPSNKEPERTIGPEGIKQLLEEENLSYAFMSGFHFLVPKEVHDILYASKERERSFDFLLEDQIKGLSKQDRKKLYQQLKEEFENV